MIAKAEFPQVSEHNTGQSRDSDCGRVDALGWIVVSWCASLVSRISPGGTGMGVCFAPPGETEILSSREKLRVSRILLISILKNKMYLVDVAENARSEYQC